ncbi:MAG: hypothetical protein KGK07_17635, partial [Chloroflexota bacterium]|nr:hypothetical protein [Chloroflexota bacterium]
MLAGALLSAQERPLTAADSLFVGRVLLAEAQRDAASPAFTEALANADGRVRLIARRAMDRIADPRFAKRDSYPPLPAPPVYADPAWRLRYRVLTAT